MNKKILLTSVAAFALLATACGGNGGSSKRSVPPEPDVPDLSALKGDYTVKMWCTEAAQDIFKSQVQAFESLHEGINIAFTTEPVSEADAMTSVISDIEGAPDMYCFAQDQFARGVQAGALQKLGVKAKEFVTQYNDAGAAGAAMSGTDAYAYPLTSDNGYFMYYDKRVVKAEHVNSLEDILADCKAANKLFSMELETSAWYLASFFFGTGCVSEWTCDNTGKFTAVNDTFNSDNGLIAAKAMKKVYDSGIHNSSSKASEFAAATPSAVVVTGTWDKGTAVEALGDNLGIAPLPSFTVDGKSYHMGSYSGNKLLGMKPCTDGNKAAVINYLCQYLTGSTCQLQRFNETALAWGPSNLIAQADPAVKADPALVALAEQNEFAKPQGQIHGSWWDLAKVIGTNVKAATDEAGLKAALKTYADGLDAILHQDPEEARKFTVIGSMNGDGWATDLPMTEGPTGTWTSEPITFVKGDEFKVRQGKSWDVAFGNGGNNYVVEEGGTFKVQLVYDEVTKTGVVTLLAAN